MCLECPIVRVKRTIRESPCTGDGALTTSFDVDDLVVKLAKDIPEVTCDASEEVGK